MDKILQSIFQAGVVGCGGAGFPTHAKLNANPEYLLVNGAECEPLLRTDRFLMLHKAKEIVSALAEIKQALRCPKTIIVMKDTYKEEIGSLKEAIVDICADIDFCLLKSFYPAGDEHAVVYEATGRVVPAAGIPLDVGCVVSNAATIYNVHKALQGVAVTRKILTVTGAVQSPCVMEVPLGISFKECITHAGGPNCNDYRVVSGGPLMGNYFSKEESEHEVVTKTTSGILLLPLNAGKKELTIEQMKNRARASCIQCTYCTELCPRYLLGHPIEPHKIMRKLAYAKDFDSLLDMDDINAATLCCECGVCELYACPMGLQPRAVNAAIKKELALRGVRYPKGEGMREVHQYREERKTPSKRIAARTGVIEYYDACKTDHCKEFSSQKVVLSLKQHIGAPSLPVIESGERVREGQLIAACPPGALGANLHASIDGVAEVLTDRIVICAE